jgi:CubicO group peptidase (beta-lactamase class C family)
VPNTPDTRFDTASITKLFTSVAAMQLVGAAKLELDASIHDYVDLGETGISEVVTLRHLLTHTSGIADDADEEDGEDYSMLFVDKPCTRSWRPPTSSHSLFTRDPGPPRAPNADTATSGTSWRV